VLPTTEGSLFTTPAADDNLVRVAESWLTRTLEAS
jgi:hypothetical protein